MFSSLEKSKLFNHSGFHLDLIGKGELVLPDSLAGKVSIYTHLPYRVSLPLHLHAVLIWMQRPIKQRHHCLALHLCLDRQGW